MLLFAILLSSSCAFAVGDTSVASQPEAVYLFRTAKLKDKTQALKVLTRMRANADTAISSAQAIASQEIMRGKTREEHTINSIHCINHVLIDLQHKFYDSEKIELPVHVVIRLQRVLSGFDLMATNLCNDGRVINTVDDYIRLIKDVFYRAIQDVSSMLTEYYEISSDDLMPIFAKPF